MSLREAVLRDLAAMTPEIQGSSMAALALACAEAMDSKASALMAKELRDTLDRLYELSPPKPKSDSLDDLEVKRARRRGSA